jgi:hypothetical protein
MTRGHRIDPNEDYLREIERMLREDTKQPTSPWACMRCNQLNPAAMRVCCRCGRHR